MRLALSALSAAATGLVALSALAQPTPSTTPAPPTASPTESIPSPPATAAPPATSPPADTGPASPAAASLEVSAKKVEAATTKLDAAGKKLEDAAKKLEQAAGKLNPSAEAKEIFAGRLTWNGLALKITEKEKKATVAASFPISNGAGLVSLEFTSPLDETTRRAALVDTRQQGAPFRVKIGLDYNAVTNHLAALLWSPERAEAQALCEQYRDENKNVTDCSPQDPESQKPFRQWLRSKSPIARPEGVFSRGIPLGVRWTLGLEVDVGFDRQDVYDGDIAGETKELTRSDASFNGVFRWYPTSFLAVPLRVGVGFEDTFKAKEVERCTALSSSDPDVSAKDCGKALVLKSDSKLSPKGMLEAAAVFALPVPGLDDVQPGFELRGRVDGLGTTPFFRGSVALFVSPTSQPVLSRIGVGAEYAVALKDDASSTPAIESGDSSVVPFLLFGGSL
jgi:hypothetical protein